MRRQKMWDSERQVESRVFQGCSHYFVTCFVLIFNHPCIYYNAIIHLSLKFKAEHFVIILIIYQLINSLHLEIWEGWLLCRGGYWACSSKGVTCTYLWDCFTDITTRLRKKINYMLKLTMFSTFYREARVFRPLPFCHHHVHILTVQLSPTSCLDLLICHLVNWWQPSSHLVTFGQHHLWPSPNLQSIQ